METTTPENDLEPVSEPSISSNPDTGPFLSDESSLKRDPQAKRNLGGRPRKDQAAPGLSAPIRPAFFPRPKFQTYKSDAANPAQRVKPFITWWNELPAWAKDRAIVYVYRDWPVLKMIPDPPAGERPTEFAYIDKISGSEPIQDEADILNRYGCGRYRLIFSEMSGSTLGSKGGSNNLAMVFITSLGNDMKSFPPADRRISEIANVEMSHPDNRSYIEFLRMRGLMPEQTEGKVKEAEVATATAVQELTQQNSKLTERAIGLAESRSKDSVVLQEAMSSAIQIGREGAQAAIQITKDANEYASKMRDAADTKRSSAGGDSKPSDPMAMALQIVALINDKGKGGSSDEVTELRRQMEKIRDDQIVELRAQLAASKTGGGSLITPGFAAAKEGMETMKGLLEFVDEVRGTGSKDNPAEEAIKDAMPPWVKYALPFAPFLAQIVTSLVGARTGQPAAYAMPAPPQPPTGWSSQPQPEPGPGLTRPALVPPQPQPNNTGLPPQVIELLDAITIPLVNHLKNQASGSDFADWFQGGYTIEDYNWVAGLGADAILNALYIYPGTAGPLQAIPQSQVKEFVEEFVNPKYDEDEQPTPNPEPQPA